MARSISRIASSVSAASALRREMTTRAGVPAVISRTASSSTALRVGGSAGLEAQLGTVTSTARGVSLLATTIKRGRLRIAIQGPFGASERQPQVEGWGGRASSSSNGDHAGLAPGLIQINVSQEAR